MFKYVAKYTLHVEDVPFNRIYMVNVFWLLHQ